MLAAMRSTGCTRANCKDVATNTSQQQQLSMLELKILSSPLEIRSPAVRLCLRCGCIILRSDPHAKHLRLPQRITTVHDLSKHFPLQKEQPKRDLLDGAVSSFWRPRPESGLSECFTADESLRDAGCTARVPEKLTTLDGFESSLA